MFNFGSIFDGIGTALNLPEIGLSESLNGGNATQNTGRVGYSPVASSVAYGGNIPARVGSVGAFNNALGQTTTGGAGSYSGKVAAPTGDQAAANDPYTGGAYTGGYGTAAAGGAGVATSDPSTAAYYQDMINQLNGQVGRLDGQLNTGLSNINNSYNTAANRLNEQKGVAQRNYNTKTQQNMQQYSNTRNGIMSNTRSAANALQRLLGLAGAGNSSAALEQAPYAAGLQGSVNLNEAQQNYGNNRGALDTSWEDTQRSFKNSFADLDQQKFSNENNLRSQIAQTRAGLLDKLGQANVNREMALGRNYQQAQAARSGYQEQINSLLDQMAGLGNQYANPVMRTGDVSFKAPELGKFSLGQQAEIQNQTGGAGNLDPTFINLLGQRDDERNRLGL